jgi:translation initiation factor IF-2
MMSVLEYAQDINKTVEEILNKCKELGIDKSTEEDMLDQDDIIMLDNAFDVLGESEEIDEEELLDSKVEELIAKENIKISDEPLVQKLKKKSDIVKETKEKMDYGNKKKEMYKHKEKLISNIPNKEDDVILYNDKMTVKSLSDTLGINPTEIIKKLMDLGIMAAINNNIDFEQAEIIVSDYNKKLKKAEENLEENFELFEINDNEEDLVPRPPVVTIMGHVDHGKTTLLDKIREANVVATEAGGITQHIGAYQVEVDGKKITFIDTPGHAAFTEMRARGASVTDIVVLIVAADDGVMPQTKEAIEHAKAAKVPIIVAINKIDKPGANVDRIMTDLTQYQLTPEEWGGDTLYSKLSALTGEGIDGLLQNILLVAEMADLKANPNRYATGTVIESRLDSKKGAIVTLLIQNGTLRLGDPIVVGDYYGKVRTLINDRKQNIVSADPSTPVEVTGLNGVPTAGDKFMAFESEKKAREIAEKRQTKSKISSLENTTAMSFDELFNKIKAGTKEINIILKTDVNGSKEAVKNSLEKINVDGVKINIVSAGVGAISESDILLASATNAIIIGFNVRPDNKVKEYAKEKNIEIRLYSIIYKVIEEIEAAMKGMLDPVYEEKVLGQAEVRKLFKFSKIGTIAGCYVISGLIKRDSKARLIRDGIVVYEGKINSLHREKEDIKEVKKGHECGITLDNFNDIKEQDVIESYEMVEIKSGA